MALASRDTQLLACWRSCSIRSPAVSLAHRYEDEPISEEENLAVAASKAWLENNKPIPHEDVLAEFGLSLEDFERMGHTPLEHHAPGQ